MTGQLPGMPKAQPDLRKIGEKAFQDQMNDLFRTFNYENQHLFPLATKNQGFRTGCTSRGWPDCLALRGEFVIAAELKAWSAAGRLGTLDPDQHKWLLRWMHVPTARVWVLNPTDPDMNTLISWLRDPAHAPKVYGWDPHTAPSPPVRRPRPAVARRLV